MSDSGRAAPAVVAQVPLATPELMSEPYAAPPPSRLDRVTWLGPAIGALGVVFGDIGTSPLYAMRECFSPAHGLHPTPENVLGVLSLIFWALTLLVSLKYLSYVLRADNKGEGGILALTALASWRLRGKSGYGLMLGLGVFGAALLYGDGVITPAISVLSAVEGLSIAAPALHHVELPIAIAVLVGLFALQKRGTSLVGAYFGPIMLLWFIALGIIGAVNLLHAPEVLAAVNPLHAFNFVAHGGSTAFYVLGGVFLVVTGGEALYADLGHFGRKPIQRVWFAVVFPGLFLNYLGQGALLLHRPAASENPFFLMVPSWALYPMVLLATLATVTASQASVSGVFSLSHQATNLGLLPRLDVRHTSAKERGQIYVPAVNWILMVSTIWVVLAFRSSEGLAAAYGIAVTLTMMSTTVLAFYVVRHDWGWSLLAATAVTACFLMPEMAFAAANLAKIKDGGWLPLTLGVGLLTLMFTWRRGREILSQRFRDQIVPLTELFARARTESVTRVPGTAVFLTSSRDGAPPALMRNFEHNHVLHERVLLVTIVTADDPRVPEAERLSVEDLGLGLQRIVARYGFMQQPDVPKLLARATGGTVDWDQTTFFLGRETLMPASKPQMARWRALLFVFLARNAQPATQFFRIPPARVMEVGAQIEL